MKELTRTLVLLLGALVALGCQKEEDASEPIAVAPEAAEPTAEEPVPAVEPPQSESVPEANPLVGKVMGLTQIKTVEETEDGIKITWPLDIARGLDESSTALDVSDKMMFATFYTAPVLYKRLTELDGLQQVFTYRGKKIGDIRMTRESYDGLDAERALQGLPDGKPKREAYRKLLKALPKGAVDINKKYWPRA